MRVENEQEREARRRGSAIKKDQLAQLRRGLRDVGSPEAFDDCLQGQIIEFDVADDIAAKHLHEAVCVCPTSLLRIRTHLPEQERSYADQAGDGEEVRND